MARASTPNSPRQASRGPLAGADRSMAPPRLARVAARAAVTGSVLTWAVWSAAAQEATSAATAGGMTPQQRRAEDAALEDLLERLELPDLRAAHLERLTRSLPVAERLAPAKRLAALYAAQLLDRSDDADAFRQTAQRMDALWQRIPEAATPDLRLTRQQAGFQRAEKLALDWLTRGDPAGKAEALPLLEASAPELTGTQALLAKQVATLDARIEAPGVSRADERRLEKELEQLQAVLLRATFLAGWSNYYLGVLGQQTPKLHLAREMFRNLLELDQPRSADVSRVA